MVGQRWEESCCMRSAEGCRKEILLASRLKRPDEYAKALPG